LTRSRTDSGIGRSVQTEDDEDEDDCNRFDSGLYLFSTLEKRIDRERVFVVDATAFAVILERTTKN